MVGEGGGQGGLFLKGVFVWGQGWQSAATCKTYKIVLAQT